MARIDSRHPSETDISLDELGAEHGIAVHRTALGLLSHQEMSEEEARSHWLAICGRRNELARQLERDPGVRVAAMDYFINRSEESSRPVAVEDLMLERTERSASLDGLTGLMTARHFRRFLSQEIRRSARRLQEFAVALLEFDDIPGSGLPPWRTVLEPALRETGGILHGRLREMDIASRGEGAGFAILLPRTRRTGAFIAVDRIREAVREHFRLHRPLPRRLPLTLSGGIASYPDDAGSAEALLDLAGRALNRARERGGDRVVPFADERREFIRFRPAAGILRLAASRDGTGPIPAGGVQDISAGGALLSPETALRPGEEILLELKEEGTPGALQISAQVVRLDPAPESPADAPAAGVRFSVDPASKAELESLLQALRRSGVE